MGTAEETVVRILGEIHRKTSCFLLHVHAPVAENVVENVDEQLHDRNAFLLLTATFLQKGADFEITENFEIELEISCLLLASDGTIDMA